MIFTSSSFSFDSSDFQNLIERKYSYDNSIELVSEELQKIKSDYNDYYHMSLISSGLLHKNSFSFRTSLIIRGRISPLYFFVNPTFINKDNGLFMLGSNYQKFNLSMGFESAYFAYINNYIKIKYGRAPISWGESTRYSIIHSKMMPHYDNLLISFNKYNFKYEMFLGQLNSKLSDNIQNENQLRIKRFISGHRLSWYPNQKISFSLGEQVIYTGLNRSLEMAYLNPFIPYFLVGLDNNENEANSFGSGDNDNSMLFLHWRFNLNEKISIYSELIVDDFQIDKTIRDNQLGLKIGFAGTRSSNANYFSWLVEWTKIDKWTYLHQGQYTNWTHKGHPIGYLFGPDIENVLIQFKYKLKHNYDIISNLNYLKKGSNSFSTNWDNDNQKKSYAKYVNLRFQNFKIAKTFNKYIIEFGLATNVFINDFIITGKEPNEKSSFFLGMTYVFTKKKGITL